MATRSLTEMTFTIPEEVIDDVLVCHRQHATAPEIDKDRMRSAFMRYMYLVVHQLADKPCRLSTKHWWYFGLGTDCKTAGLKGRDLCPPCRAEENLLMEVLFD